MESIFKIQDVSEEDTGIFLQTIHIISWQKKIKGVFICSALDYAQPSAPDHTQVLSGGIGLLLHPYMPNNSWNSNTVFYF